eukprot:gene30555-36926_t
MPLDSINWPAVLQGDAESLYAAYSRDLSSFTPKVLSKITLRLHSISLSSQAPLNCNQIVVKSSIQPVPGSAVSMRASTFDSAISTSESNPGEFAMRTYLFSNKSANLSMSEGEIRSRMLKSGEFARLSLQVCYPTLSATSASSSTSAGEVVCIAEVYLPALLRDHNAEPLEVRLLTLCPSLISGGSLPLEVRLLTLCPSLISGGSLVLEASTPLSQSSPPSSQSTQSSALARQALQLDLRVYALLQRRRPCSSPTSLTVSLGASGESLNVPLPATAPGKAPPSSPQRMSATSLLPGLEVLLLQVARDQSEGGEGVGVLRIPLGVLLLLQGPPQGAGRGDELFLEASPQQHALFRWDSLTSAQRTPSEYTLVLGARGALLPRPAPSPALRLCAPPPLSPQATSSSPLLQQTAAAAAAAAAAADDVNIAPVCTSTPFLLNAPPQSLRAELRVRVGGLVLRSEGLATGAGDTGNTGAWTSSTLLSTIPQSTTSPSPSPLSPQLLSCELRVLPGPMPPAPAPCALPPLPPAALPADTLLRGYVDWSSSAGKSGDLVFPLTWALPQREAA